MPPSANGRTYQPSRLAAGICGRELADAAEVMRDHSPFDLAAFQEMMTNVFCPLNNQFLTGHNDACITNYWADWDLCHMASVLAIGILNDDAATYDQAVTYFKSGAGDGSIEHAVPHLCTDSDGSALGQWQESGRGQGHTVKGMGQMGAVCEMAWNQGDDLDSQGDRRFVKAAQYVAEYNTGRSVPCATCSTSPPCTTTSSPPRAAETPARPAAAATSSTSAP
ncbi:hypothetical protein BIV25_19115 [Streptomyces sp. MUSC 14]|nr:hypothetical protein BIV25_19115 [Streptomyces sp. MUSC 14]